MIVEARAVPPLSKNGFIVGCPDTREAVIIDPGDEVAELLDIVRRGNLTVRYILLTHAHFDHITGVGRAKAAFGVPIGLHRADEFLYKAAKQQGFAFGVKIEAQPPIDFYLEDDSHFDVGDYDIWVRHTPGHAPGGVCLAVTGVEDDTSTLFVGDTLFSGGIGRTDLPGGDLQTLLTSIREVLFSFPDDAVVWPGHGPSTTIGRERKTNPFLIQGA